MFFTERNKIKFYDIIKRSKKIIKGRKPKIINWNASKESNIKRYLNTKKFNLKEIQRVNLCLFLVSWWFTGKNGKLIISWYWTCTDIFRLNDEKSNLKNCKCEFIGVSVS